jgi:integration host factor subunit alpha
MTKADIVQAVYTKLGGFSKKEAADLVDQVFDSMKETLGRGEKIKISGFGNFVLRDKRQRQGRNPQTGEPIVITARRVLNFKASQLLKQALNEGPAPAWPEASAAAGAEPSGQTGPGPSFSACLRSWLALKFSTRRAVITIGSPVCGLRPCRCLLSRSTKLPKPEILIFSPRPRVSFIESNT